MPSRARFDTSPLASQICAGHYAQTNPGTVRRPHGLQDWGLVYTLAGSGRFYGTDKTADALLTRPGLLVLVPPGTAHSMSVRSGEMCDHLWLHFLARPHWIEWLDWPAHLSGVRMLFVPAGRLRRAVVGAFRNIVRLTLSSAPDRELFALNALEELLLWCQRIKPQPAATVSDPSIHVCLEHISNNLYEVITLAALARLSGQSVSRLTHQFRRQIGLTPMQYLEQRRLDRAMQLLARTSMRVKDIAAAVGFENPFYFTLRFKKHTGYSPRAFRQETSRPTTILRRPGLDLNPEDRKVLGQSGND